MKEKCPNPNCKNGLVGMIDTGFDHPIACCICEGKGEVDVIQKKEYPPSIRQ